MPNENISRRDFIKKAGMAVASAGFVGDKILENTGNPEQEEAIEKKIKEEIEACKNIIESKQFGQILEHPYLVSALYYSQEALRSISIAPRYPAGKIIRAINPLITREFREKYFDFLKEEVQKRNTRNINLETEALPLAEINWKDADVNHLDALDLFTEEGSLVYSSAGGLVVLAENGWELKNAMSTSSMGGGNSVIVFNPTNMSFYRYAHLQETGLSVGEVVASKDIIGKVGHTGINASKKGHGGHLHFEINQYSREWGLMEAKKFAEIQSKLRAMM